MAVETKRILSGTWGEVWLNGTKVLEVKALNAKVEYKKEEINQCGVMFTGHKVLAITGKGSFKINKAFSLMLEQIDKTIVDGKDKRYTIVSKVSDPDAYGDERIKLSHVSFDDLTLVNFEAATAQEDEVPFTFEDYDILETIPQQ